PRAPLSFPTRRSSDLGAQQGFHFVHQGAVVPAGPIPFQQGEFGMMQTTLLAGAKRLAEVIDRRWMDGKQPFQKILGRTLKVPERDRKSTRLNSSHVKI